MNILIVNAFGNTSRGKEKSSKFYSGIHKLFKKNYIKGVEEPYYTHLSIDRLDDFLYSKDDFLKTKSFVKRNNIDKMDIVFIDGIEKNNLPWDETGFKLGNLISLCESKRKIILCAGIATLHLLYAGSNNLTENNAHRICNFINSNGDYPSIEDLPKIPHEFLKHVKQSDIFLDYPTGDVYEYDKTSKWVPKSNIGFHNLLYAEKFLTRGGKFVTKESLLKQNEEGVTAYKKEIIMKIIKEYSEHWLFKDTKKEMVVNTSLNWFQHNGCMPKFKLQYKTLCTSNYGAMVIEHGNSMGLGFHINSKYGETVKIIENFIIEKLKFIQSPMYIVSKYNDIHSIEAEKLFRTVIKEDHGNISNIDPTTLNSHSLISKVNHSQKYSLGRYNKNEAPHCGIGYGTKNMIFVENNSTNPQIITVKNKSNETKNEGTRLKQAVDENGEKMDFDYLKLPKDMEDSEIVEYYKKKTREICERGHNIKGHQEEKKNNMISTKLTKRCGSAMSQNQKRVSQSDNSGLSDSRGKETSTIVASTTKGGTIENKNNQGNSEKESIINMIFPYIRETDGGLKPQETAKKERIKVNGQTNIKSNFIEKYKKYNDELKVGGKKPFVRCSSTYKTREEIEKNDFDKSKTKWLTKTDFKTYFDNLTLGKTQTDNILKYYKDNNQGRKLEKSNSCMSVGNYKYREIDKSKWISKRGFKAF